MIIQFNDVCVYFFELLTLDSIDKKRDLCATAAQCNRRSRGQTMAERGDGSQRWERDKGGAGRGEMDSIQKAWGRGSGRAMSSAANRIFNTSCTSFMYPVI